MKSWKKEHAFLTIDAESTTDINNIAKSLNAALGMKSLNAVLAVIVLV